MRLFKLLNLLFVVHAFALCTNAHACDTDMVRDYVPISKRSHKELLYVVDNCKRPASYLFGTIHLDDEKVKDSAAPAFAALKASKRAIFEIKNSKQNQEKTVALMILPPSEQRTLSDIIGWSEFQLLAKEIQTLKPGFPLAMLERYRPWAASILVQLPPASGDNIHLDDRLQLEAKQLSLPVIGLETPESQMAVFTMLTEKEQVTLMQDTLAHIHTLREQNETLKELYLQKDLQGIYRLGDKAFEEISDSKMRNYLKRELIVKRNEAMAQALQPYLTKGRSFIAVGALHLPGTEGLLNKLEKAGYFIWPASVVGKP